MSRLLPVLVLLLAGCPHDHDHDHAGGHDHDHKHGEEAPHEHAPAEATEAPAEAAPAEDAAAGEAVSFPLGAWTGSLTVAADSLKLTLAGADGAAVAAEGEAKVVLTGVGEEAQRLTLPAADGGWAGPAKATGAKGYTAVVSVTVGGVTESGKATWGDVPAPKPVEPKDDHDHEAGHSHEHDGGHSH